MTMSTTIMMSTTMTMSTLPPYRINNQVKISS
jgi:hypothetical protein